MNKTAWKFVSYFGIALIVFGVFAAVSAFTEMRDVEKKLGVTGWVLEGWQTYAPGVRDTIYFFNVAARFLILAVPGVILFFLGRHFEQKA